MKRRSVVSIIVVTLIGLWPCLTLHANNIRLDNLMVEYARAPLGIDEEKVRFSWQMLSDDHRRGCSQVAYQLIVSEEKGKVVWDSGKKEDNTALNIVYEGVSLEATTRYDWRVNVWTQDGQEISSTSWFETGLMNPDPLLSGWDGAKWIGGGDEDLVLYPSYKPIFKINYAVRLDQENHSTKAGFIYGANDSRLLDKNKNIYQLENKKNESYILVELDISELNEGQDAYLHVYRVGYHPDDRKDRPIHSFPISANIINEKNKYQWHTIFISSIYGTTTFFADGMEKEHKIGEIFMNPLGYWGDFIAFPMIADIGFSMLPDQKAYFSHVEIRNFRDPCNCLFSENLGGEACKSLFYSYSNENPEEFIIQDNEYLVGGNSRMRVIANPGRNSMPMLRSLFQASSSPVKARLYATSRGIYEMYINGQRVGNDYFNPGLTQYNRTHMYQTYDVTKYISGGRNVIGALLGEGWWSGSATYAGEFWNFFGDRQSLLAKLVLTYADGRTETIVTNPETWTYYNDGPIVYGSFFQGEVYDALKEKNVENWSTIGYDDKAWKMAQEVTDKYISRDEVNKGFNAPMVDDYSRMRLIGQIGQNVSKCKELMACSVEEVRPGVFVYDMGQNMVGVPKIQLSGLHPGTQVTLRYAESKYPDFEQYKDLSGMIMLENIRGALAQDFYIAKGGEEVINPRFTFHGYRFVEITGIDNPLPIKAVKGEVISSIDQLASEYKTSNSKVNRLWENITWSTYSNFLSIPTDCPQRNERMGWGGDISVFSRTATYLAHVPQFLRRHMLAMRDVQREDGRFPDVAPLGGAFGEMLWGSAGITVAWESYQQYNDQRLLAEHYEAMKAYTQYLIASIDPETGLFSRLGLGDWLGPEQRKNDNTLIWEAYFIYDLELMQKVASILGKEADAESFKSLCAQRKKFFNETYVDPFTQKMIHSGFKQDAKMSVEAGDLVDTQVSYILPLLFDIYKDEYKEKALENFIQTIRRENVADIGTVCPPYSLMTGFIGTAWISKVLSDYGHVDVAYRLLQQTSYPSWLYPVEQGATTIWERLNSYTHTEGFGGNNSMNSFNHYSFGAVGAWMYNYSLGIERDERFPGFKHFILQPNPDPTGEMTFARGYYDSMYGRISSGWEVQGDICYYRFSVPCNTTATLYLSASSIEKIKEGTNDIRDCVGIEYVGIEKGKVKFKLQAGDYYFTVR